MTARDVFRIHAIAGGVATGLVYGGALVIWLLGAFEQPDSMAVCDCRDANPTKEGQ